MINDDQGAWVSSDDCGNRMQCMTGGVPAGLSWGGWSAVTSSWDGPREEFIVFAFSAVILKTH